MASPSEAPRMDQIVSQFLLKALHAVLAARIPQLGSTPSSPIAHASAHSAGRARKRDRWFNLALGDPPAALEALNFWHRSSVDPMVVDIILSPTSTGVTETITDSETETVVERWIVRYDPSPNHTVTSSSTPPPGSSSRTYKKSIVLLRSIYALLRLLPTHRAYRMLAAPNHTCNFTLTYRVSSFADPMGPRDEQLMTRHDFTPVEALPGVLSASVTYRPRIADEFNLQSSPLIPPLIIPDYVGSPAADPMRAFGPGHASPSYGAAGGTPSSLPATFTRPHSWTNPSMAHHPLSGSPDYSHGRSPPLPVPIPGRQMTNTSAGAATPSSSSSSGSHHRHLHHQFRAMSFGGRRSGGQHYYYDDYRLSPPSLSASPTPSPPLHPNSPLRNRLHSDTAPVSIPQPLPGKSILQRTPSSSDPMRSLFPPPSPRSAAGSVKGDAQAQAIPAMGESPSEGGSARSFNKIEGFRPGEHISTLPVYAIHKGSKDSKEDSGRISGIFSSCGSPRVGFSRSSSRLSFNDDLDDGGLNMPFAMDNIDGSDSQTRNLDSKDGPESSQPSSSIRKSQDAAVGVLVHVLRTAPPLRQDSYSPQSSKSEFGGDVGSSSFFTSRKTADAMEELRSYKEMKDMLLSQSQSRAKLTDSRQQGQPK